MSTFFLAATVDSGTVLAMKTVISRWAPAKERQRLVAHSITTEVVKVYRRTGDSAGTKEDLWWRYAEIVPEPEQVWMDEDLYLQFVEHVIASIDLFRDDGPDLQFPD